MLESNSYVKSLVNVDQSLRGSRDVYKVWSAYNYLRSAISIENDFANYFVFYKANDVVLSNIYTAVSPLY